MREKFQGDFIRFSGYNRMTDGTVASTKGDLLEPYEGTDMHCSIQVDYPMIEKEVQLADENGFRYSLHAQGMEQYIKWLVFLINVRRKMESL